VPQFFFIKQIFTISITGRLNHDLHQLLQHFKLNEREVLTRFKNEWCSWYISFERMFFAKIIHVIYREGNINLAGFLDINKSNNILYHPNENINNLSFQVYKRKSVDLKFNKEFNCV
jgi:hypothetical protein